MIYIYIYTMLYYILFYHVILYFVVLYSFILHCITLHCIILYPWESMLAINAYVEMLFRFDYGAHVPI